MKSTKNNIEAEVILEFEESLLPKNMPEVSPAFSIIVFLSIYLPKLFFE